MSSQKSNPNRVHPQTQPAWAKRLEAKIDRLLEADAQPPQPGQSRQPTFCGYRCSWDIDDAGWPSYIHLEDGSLASLRTGKGSTDHWYSVKLSDGNYGEHYLKFRRASPPEGLLVMPSQASPPPPAKPAKPAKQAKPPAKAVASHRRNGQPPPAPPAASDVQLSTSAQMRKIEALGRADYGRQWPGKKQELVGHFTRDAKRPLSRDQADFIIQGLQARAAKSAAPPAVEPPPARQKMGFVNQADPATLTRSQAVQMQRGAQNGS